jgi:hypothetical protein
MYFVSVVVLEHTIVVITATFFIFIVSVGPNCVCYLRSCLRMQYSGYHHGVLFRLPKHVFVEHCI